MENRTNREDKDYSATIFTHNLATKTSEKTSIDVDDNEPSIRKVTIDKTINIINRKESDFSECRAELLEQLYSSTLEAIQSIEMALDNIGSEQLRTIVDKYYIEFKDIFTKTIDFMMENGFQPEKLGTISKVLHWSTIQFNRLRRKGDSEIAQMIINGVTFGIIDMYRALNRCGHEEQLQPKPLSNELISSYKSFIDELVTVL